MAQRALLLGIFAVLLAACGTSTPADAPALDTAEPQARDESPAPDRAADDPAADPSTPPPAAEPADDDHPLAFTARVLSGGSLDLSRFAGQPVAVWMWAPW
ncbi:MAG: hypothetical protein WD377_00535 [Nitriliruptoraceae bacterium]